MPETGPNFHDLENSFKPGKLTPFLDKLTLVETQLINNPNDRSLQEEKRRLWAHATDDDLHAWAGLQVGLTQDPTSELVAGVDDLLLEAEKLRSQAIAEAGETEDNFTLPGQEEFDELAGEEGDDRFKKWAHNMAKRLGMDKKRMN